MSRFRAVWWCAIVVYWVGVSAQYADAQFGGGGQGGRNIDAGRRIQNAFDAAAPTGRLSAPPALPCQCAGEATAAAESRIKQQLSQPLKSPGFEFVEQPLEDVLNFLQEEYDIPIQLDVKALEDAGLTTDEPVTCNLRNVTLRSALRLMLRQNQLTYVIGNEVLTITTPERAEQSLVTCVYDVQDLVPDGRRFQALADAITACVATETWAKNEGGEAEIRPVYPGLFVISQTQAVHDEVAGLLAAIRKVRQDGNSAQEFSHHLEAFGGEFGQEREPTPADPFGP